MRKIINVYAFICYSNHNVEETLKWLSMQLTSESSMFGHNKSLSPI